VVAQLQRPEFALARLREVDPRRDWSPLLRDWGFASDGRFSWVCGLDGVVDAGCVLNDGVTDPEWRHDARAQQPEALARLAAALERLPRFRARMPGVLEPDQHERLRALGYLD